MRISTNQMQAQGVRAIVEGQVRVTQVQSQLSSGRRILSPADDPAGSARLLELRQQIEANAQYQKNLTLATGQLALEESVLDGAGGVLQRARELTVQGGNGALSPENRLSIAQEVRQLLNQLQDLGNTKDGNGDYLFAGYQARTAPFALSATGVDYQGDQGQRLVQVGPSRQVAVNDSGDEVFMRVRNGNQDIFTTLQNLATALEAPADSAQLTQSLANSLTDLDHGITHLSDIRGRIGARLNSLEGQEQANQEFDLRMRKIVADIDGLDYAEAATRLNEGLLALQVAQQSFVKIQGLSLFNYLR